jgi:hypothetical protein
VHVLLVSFPVLVNLLVDVIYTSLDPRMYPFLPGRYEPNVKTVFKRNPGYFRKEQPYVDGVEWLVIEDESTSAIARGLLEWSLPIDQLGAGGRH